MTDPKKEATDRALYFEVNKYYIEHHFSLAKACTIAGINSTRYYRICDKYQLQTAPETTDNDNDNDNVDVFTKRSRRGIVRTKKDRTIKNNSIISDTSRRRTVSTSSAVTSSPVTSSAVTSPVTSSAVTSSAVTSSVTSSAVTTSDNNRQRKRSVFDEMNGKPRIPIMIVSDTQNTEQYREMSESYFNRPNGNRERIMVEKVSAKSEQADKMISKPTQHDKTISKPIHTDRASKDDKKQNVMNQMMKNMMNTVNQNVGEDVFSSH